METMQDTTLLSSANQKLFKPLTSIIAEKVRFKDENGNRCKYNVLVMTSNGLINVYTEPVERDNLLNSSTHILTALTCGAVVSIYDEHHNSVQISLRDGYLGYSEVNC